MKIAITKGQESCLLPEYREARSVPKEALEFVPRHVGGTWPPGGVPSGMGGRFITTQRKLIIYLSRDGLAGSIDIVIIHYDYT